MYGHTYIIIIIIIIIINGTLISPISRTRGHSTECEEHTIHTQTQVVAISRKPQEIKRTHEGEAKFTT